MVPEEELEQYLKAIRRGDDDAVLEQMLEAMEFQSGGLSHDQNVRVREARLDRARGKALENELEKKNALLQSEDDYIAEHAVEENGSAKSSTLVRKLFVGFVAIILIGIAYHGYLELKDNEGDICRTHCCDGTCSPSVGAGTCSYHGGICEK